MAFVNTSKIVRRTIDRNQPAKQDGYYFGKNIGEIWNALSGQKAQNEFNAREAEKQRQFELEMYQRQLEASNTAIQRQKADALAAGVNPDFLFYNSSSGAGTPAAGTGSAASGGSGSGAGMIGALSGMVASAASYANNKNITKQQSAQMNSQAKNLMKIAAKIATKKLKF